MAGKEDSTDGTTPDKGEAARAMAGVGGVRSSDDPVLDLWSGQPTEERRDANPGTPLDSGALNLGTGLNGT